MSNNKQSSDHLPDVGEKVSSIDWLIKQFNLQSYVPHIEQAKAMHKEEIVNAYNHAYEEGWDCNDWKPEQYYNETFGGDNE